MPLRLLGRRFLPAWRFYSTVDLSQLENHESHCSKVPNENCKLKMSGWQIHTYGKTEELQFATALRMPFIESASECLVRVLATTVNPIDVAMLGGYGATILNMMRCNFPNSIEFPLILGREFCGEVIQRGNCVNKNLSVGDRVWGVVPLQSNGSHAEYVLVPDYCKMEFSFDLDDDEPGTSQSSVPRRFEVPVPFLANTARQPSALNNDSEGTTPMERLLEAISRIEARQEEILNRLSAVESALEKKMLERAEVQAQGELLRECRVLTAKTQRSIGRITGDVGSEEQVLLQSMLPMSSEEVVMKMEDHLKNKAYADAIY